MEKQKIIFRKTKQRDIILQVLSSTDTHPTAEWIYNEVRKELPNISLGTIYRNLRHLIAVGKAVEYTCQGDPSKFDAKVTMHYHMTCSVCNKMVDVDNNLLPTDKVNQIKDIFDSLSEHTGFKLLNHCMRFKGICPECQATNIKDEDEIDAV